MEPFWIIVGYLVVGTVMAILMVAGNHAYSDGEQDGIIIFASLSLWPLLVIVFVVEVFFLSIIAIGEAWAKKLPPKEED